MKLSGKTQDQLDAEAAGSANVLDIEADAASIDNISRSVLYAIIASLAGTATPDDEKQIRLADTQLKALIVSITEKKKKIPKQEASA